MTTPQRPIGSGFGYRSTAAEVLDGIDLGGRARDRHRRLLGPRARDRARAERRGRRRRRPRPAARRTPPRCSPASSACEVDELDLGDLDSVRALRASACSTRAAAVDILINNAAIMACPETRVGPGWEAQFATNHLGHFALANLLWPLLARRRRRARGRALLDRPQALRHPLGRPAVRAAATTSGRPTGRRRPPTRCSPSSSTRSARTPACARSPRTPAASSRRSSATSRARR